MAKDTFSEYIKSPLATPVLLAFLNATDVKPWAKQMVVWIDTQLLKGDVKKTAIKFADKLIEMATAIVKEAEKL